MLAEFIAPSENDVVNAGQFTLQVRVTPDAGRTIVNGTVSVNAGTPLALNYDAAANVWKKSVAVPFGPVTALFSMTDSTASTVEFTLNFSNSPSNAFPPIVDITSPTEGQVLHKPGHVVQVDVTRADKVARVEISFNKGKSWVRMNIPRSSGGS